MTNIQIYKYTNIDTEKWPIQIKVQKHVPEPEPVNANTNTANIRKYKRN